LLICVKSIDPFFSPLVHPGHARRELLRPQRRLPRNARPDLPLEPRVERAELGQALDAILEQARGRDRLDRFRDAGERVGVLAARGDEAAVPDEDVGGDAVGRVDGGDLRKERKERGKKERTVKFFVVSFFLFFSGFPTLRVSLSLSLSLFFSGKKEKGRRRRKRKRSQKKQEERRKKRAPSGSSLEKEKPRSVRA